MGFTFLSLVYLENHQEELNGKDLNFIKRGFKYILKKHRRRIIYQS